MSYQKQNFANGEVLTAAQLNHIENGIADVESAANATKGVVDKIIDPTLSVSGKAADAAKVGEVVNAEAERAKGVENQLKEDLADFSDMFDSEKGMNLFDVSKSSDDTSINDDGITWTAVGYFVSDFISVDETRKYSFAVTQRNNQIGNPAISRILGYSNIDGGSVTPMGTYSAGGAFKKIDIPNGVKSIRFLVNKSATYLSPIMFYDSTEMSSFPQAIEPYTETIVLVDSDYVRAKGFKNALVKKMNKKIAYSVISDTVILASVFDETKDIVITLNKHGGNNIFDFRYFSLNSRTSELPSVDFSNLTHIVSKAGDWHGPFQIEAKNNIDGDMPVNTHYTGGNHEYTNTGSGGTPTGRTSKLLFFADNIPVTNGVGYADTFSVIWENMVQARNTKKVDGTGREVLKEIHRATYDGYEWSELITIVPLEDIYCIMYHCWQTLGNVSAFSKVKFMGGNDYRVIDIANATNSVNALDMTPSLLYQEGSNLILESEIVKDFELGNMNLNKSRISMYANGLPYGKSYFNLIVNNDLLLGNEYSVMFKMRCKKPM